MVKLHRLPCLRNQGAALSTLAVVLGLMLWFPPAAGGQSPATPPPLFVKALQAQQEGKLPEAVDLYRKLLASQPGLLPARANLAVALAQLGKYNAAIREYRLALRQAPGNPMLELDLALAYFKSAQFSQACQWFELLHKSRPTDARIRTLLAESELKSGKASAAVALLRDEPQGDDLDADWVLAQAYLKTGNVAKGAPLAERVGLARHNARAYQSAAQALFQNGFYPQALKDLNAASRLQRNLPGLEMLRGRIQASANQIEAARATFRAILARRPNDYEALLQLGDLDYNQGHFARAKAYVIRALRLKPNEPRGLYELGRIQVHEGQLQAAVTSLQRAEKEWPIWILPHSELAMLYYRLGKPALGKRERQEIARLQAAGGAHQGISNLSVPAPGQ